MTSEELQMVAFEIILNSGNARTIVHESFSTMRNGDLEKASELLNQANEEMLLAHKSQTKLLQDYAGGEIINVEIIMVHAQDHLMTTMTLREVALEMLEMYKKLESLKEV